MSFLETLKPQLALRVSSLKKRANAAERTFTSPLSLPRHESFLWFTEIKQASPSRGTIATRSNSVDIAKGYVSAGTSVISVLTEPTYFKGSLEVLSKIRTACPDTPLLMKDFIIDASQIIAGYNAGADLYLLMLSLLDDADFVKLLHKGESLGMTALIEIHTVEEAQRLICLVASQKIVPPLLIGVNHRCLHHLTLDMQQSKRLYATLKENFAEAVLIGESGLTCPEDVQRLQDMGYQGALVGSALMQTPSPGHTLKKWKSVLEQEHTIL